MQMTMKPERRQCGIEEHSSSPKCPCDSRYYGNWSQEIVTVKVFKLRLNCWLTFCYVIT